VDIQLGISIHDEKVTNIVTQCTIAKKMPDPVVKSSRLSVPIKSGHL
jgi:hypothetical protein